MQKLLIIDLESTCYERGTEPKDFFSEIIEIGGVFFNPETKKNEWEFDEILRPQLFPTLSEFCTGLTTLTQEHVDRGISLAEALASLNKKIESEPYLFASWGFYDRNQFQKNCERFGIPYPFGPRHVSLKHEFANWTKRKPMGMAGALNVLRLPLEGTHHRGLDDARNISKIAGWMIEQGWKTLLANEA